MGEVSSHELLHSMWRKNGCWRCILHQLRRHGRAHDAAPRATPALVSSMPNAPAPKPTPWGKILAVVLVLIVLLVGSVIGGLVYVGYRVKQKVAEFTRTENAPSTQEAPSSQAPPENGDSGKSPANSPTNNQNEQVSKALDGIGGLMDRLGFGDPPPNPYADLPVATSAEISKNLCPSADTAQGAAAAGSFRNRPQRHPHARRTHDHSFLGTQTRRLGKH